MRFSGLPPVLNVNDAKLIVAKQEALLSDSALTQIAIFVQLTTRLPEQALRRYYGYYTKIFLLRMS
jgi:hypothetical protein